MFVKPHYRKTVTAIVMKLSEYTDDVYGIIVSLYRNQVDNHNLLK